jgi:tetratricopeptide (TPR) repeat protein
MLQFILTSMLVVATPPDKGAPAASTWDGKLVLIKQASVRFGEFDDKGNLVKAMALTGMDYKVLADKDERLQIKTVQGATGWIKKADAVLLEDAVAFFSKRIQDKPDDFDAFNRRALCWKLKGEQDQAIKDFTESIRLRPNAATYNNRAIAHHAKKDFDRALADYAEALRLSPNFAAVYNNRGHLWSTRKDYPKAIDDFSAAIRLDPRFALAIRNRAGAYFATREYNKAIDDYTRVIELDPNSVQAYHDRGRAWNAKSDFDKAIADYDRAVKLEPKNPIIVHNRGIAWRNKKDDDKAIDDFGAALKLNPNFGPTFLERGQAWSRKKEYEKALADFNDSLKLAPKYEPACNAAAWLLATCPQESVRDGKRALELAKQATSVLKTNPNYLDTLAAAHAEVGNFDEAVRVQEQVLQSERFMKDEDARARLELYKKKQPYRQPD